MQNEGITRRNLIKGAGTATAAIVAAGAVAMPASSAQAEQSAAPVRPWETKPAPIADDQITAVYECDLCVVGAGVSGVCCAQSAAEEGASVIVLEKSDKPQGRGLDIGSINNQFQKDNPDIAQYIDATEAERIYYEFSHCSVNRLLFRHWAQHSGEAFDHLADYLKENYGLEPAMSYTANPAVFDASDYYREMPTCQEFGEGWFDDEGNRVMAGVVQKIATWAEDLGAQFIFNAPAEQLVQDETGAVTGVVAKTEDGYIRIDAKQGVILCTGDIGGNQQMLEDWCPIAARCTESVYTPAGGNAGDGICLGLWAGAATQHGYPAPMIHPMGIGGPLAQGGDALGFLCVNMEGERYTVEFNNTPGMSNARFMQPQGVTYSIFDANYADNVLKVKPTNIAIDGSPIVGEGTQAKIDAAVNANDGTCFAADSIEELAEQMGIPAATLSATVARWNELCAQGEDTDMALDSLYLNPIDTPPFYASFNPQAILVVVYGLNCDSHSRVCDKDDHPIPGLYAVGNIQGNFFSADYPLICPGVSHGRCVTFGYTLPKAILKGELL